MPAASKNAVLGEKQEDFHRIFSTGCGKRKEVFDKLPHKRQINALSAVENPVESVDKIDSALSGGSDR